VSNPRGYRCFEHFFKNSVQPHEKNDLLRLKSGELPTGKVTCFFSIIIYFPNLCASLSFFITFAN